MPNKLESLQECFGGELNFWAMVSTTYTLEFDYLSNYPEKKPQLIFMLSSILPDRNGI